MLEINLSLYFIFHTVLFCLYDNDQIEKKYFVYSYSLLLKSAAKLQTHSELEIWQTWRIGSKLFLINFISILAICVIHLIQILTLFRMGLFWQSHISYNDETWYSYTLPKGDRKITWHTPWFLLTSAFITRNRQLLLYQEIQIHIAF